MGYQRTVQVLQAFRAIGLFTAMQLTCEIGDIRRFARPKALMAYLGLVPSEHSSGNRTRHGSITKAGNSHARKALVSAAWKYTHYPRRSQALHQRQRHCAGGSGDHQLEGPAATTQTIPRPDSARCAAHESHRWPLRANSWAFSGKPCRRCHRHRWPLRP